MTDDQPKKKYPTRGFASIDPELRRQLASKGGRNSSANFARNPELAKRAGRLGGMAGKGKKREPRA